MRTDSSGNWSDLKPKVSERWNKLTKDDLKKIKGIDQLASTVQVAYGITKDEAERQVASFKNQCGCGCEDNDPRALAENAKPRPG